MILLSSLALISSLLVISSARTVLSIIWLVGVFILVAGVLSLSTLTYVALTYVIVYIGAIAILFLFVVQLLDQNVTKIRSEFAFYFKKSLPLALLLGLFLLIELGETLPSVSLAIESSQVLPGFHWLGYKSFILLQNLDSGSLFNTDFSSQLLGPGQWNTYINLDSINERNSGDSLDTFISITNQVKLFGEWLYGNASIALVIVSVILLLSMIGPIVICWSLH